MSNEEIVKDEDRSFDEQKQRVFGINKEQYDKFIKVPVQDRILFVSHCITPELHERIAQICQELGYRYYKVGGGSVVRKIMKNEQPKAVIGVACFREIEEIANAIKIPYMTVMLTNDTCKNTEFEFSELEAVLKLVERPHQPDLQK